MTDTPKPPSSDAASLWELSASQKHDLLAALHSIKWSAELLTPLDDSAPPCELIAAHLKKAHAQLAPYIEAILAQNKG